MTLRLLEAEIAAGCAGPVVREQHRRMLRVFQKWAAQANDAMPGDMLPIRHLVGVQFGAILGAADYAARRPATAG